MIILIEMSKIKNIFKKLYMFKYIKKKYTKD